MPETPDILAYLEALAPRVVDQPIERARLLSPFVLRTVDPPFAELHGKRVRALDRLGKRIVFVLEDDLYLVIHLMIAGRLRWRDRDGKLFGPNPRSRRSTSPAERWRSPKRVPSGARRFISSAESALEPFRRSGLNVLEISEDQFAERLRSESHTLKRALTDPRLFDGIGSVARMRFCTGRGSRPFSYAAPTRRGGHVSPLRERAVELRRRIDRLGPRRGKTFPR